MKLSKRNKIDKNENNNIFSNNIKWKDYDGD